MKARRRCWPTACLPAFRKPDTMLAFHNSASLPAGTIGLTPGPALANVDSVDITVRGVGSHGAAPQNGRDPIVVARASSSTLQTLVSRERNPFDPAVVTVGSFHAGATHNIIPDEAKLQITVRSYTPEVRQSLLDGIRRIARGEAIAAGVPDDRMPVVTVRDPYTPATVNSADLTDEARTLFTGLFGESRVRMVPAAMVGEDFSRFLIANPQGRSLLFWVGGVPQARWDAAGGEITKLPGLHSPLVGARRRTGDRHRRRGDGSRDAGGAQKLTLTAAVVHPSFVNFSDSGGRGQPARFLEPRAWRGGDGRRPAVAAARLGRRTRAKAAARRPARDRRFGMAWRGHGRHHARRQCRNRAQPHLGGDAVRPVERRRRRCPAAGRRAGLWRGGAGARRADLDRQPCPIGTALPTSSPSRQRASCCAPSLRPAR